MVRDHFGNDIAILEYLAYACLPGTVWESLLYAVA